MVDKWIIENGQAVRLEQDRVAQLSTEEVYARIARHELSRPDRQPKPGDATDLTYSTEGLSGDPYAAQLCLAEVEAERRAQDEKWGEQNHPSYSSQRSDFERGFALKLARIAEANARERKQLSWEDILLEEVYESLNETDTSKLRAELVQVAAVAVAWIECLDRKAKGNAE